MRAPAVRAVVRAKQDPQGRQEMRSGGCVSTVVCPTTLAARLRATICAVSCTTSLRDRLLPHVLSPRPTTGLHTTPAGRCTCRGVASDGGSSSSSSAAFPQVTAVTMAATEHAGDLPAVVCYHYPCTDGEVHGSTAGGGGGSAGQWGSSGDVRTQPPSLWVARKRKLCMCVCAGGGAGQDSPHHARQLSLPRSLFSPCVLRPCCLRNPRQCAAMLSGDAAGCCNKPASHPTGPRSPSAASCHPIPLRPW